TNGTGVLGADQFFQGARISGGRTKNFRNGRIDADDTAFGIERKRAGRNVFQDGFDELTPAFQFADGVLKIVRELIDLRARVAELGSHAVERAHQVAELVVGLFGDLIVEIPSRDFARAFCQGLNGTGDLFGEIESDPKYGREKKHGEKRQDKEQLALEGAKV